MEPGNVHVKWVHGPRPKQSCDNAHPVTSWPSGSGPQQTVGPKGDGTYAIQNTNWAQQLFALGYGGYTWQYGDGSRTC